MCLCTPEFADGHLEEWGLHCLLHLARFQMNPTLKQLSLTSQGQHSQTPRLLSLTSQGQYSQTPRLPQLRLLLKVSSGSHCGFQGFCSGYSDSLTYNLHR